ncbi:MAG: S41 family peptidase [Rikenellaceae bacterium]|nr:S41 family peptidase [Rikenellaceae bacterium]
MENKYRNSTRNIIFPLILAAGVIGGIFIGMLTAHKRAPAQGAGQLPRLNARNYGENKLVYALSLIDKLYVDSVNVDTLSEAAIEKLIAELDPHSTYIPASDFASMNETLDGEFDGVGILFNMGTDTVIVLNVIAGGPSYEAGVRNGDRIITIDDSLVAGQKVNQNDIMKMLRGLRGTTVDLGLQRQGIDQLVPVTVTRGVIPVKSLDAAFMIKPGIGYVKLSAFAKNSSRELGAALHRLQQHGMTKLIFDLRGNSGGFLDQAIDIAKMFLPSRQLIVYTVDRNGDRTEEYSDGRGAYKDIDIAILVDEGSASSSEILAGAVQDNDRGIIIGRRTFGKGLVQQQIPFSDGSALRLTIARYYTPTGRSIQKPYGNGSDDYHSELYQRIQHQELFTADSIRFDDSLRFITPGGRTVYGGGGIMPDIFVPLDTLGYSKYYSEVWGKNILYRYTLDYADRHRDRLNAISSVQELNDMLDSDGTLLSDFIAYAGRQGVPANYSDIAKSREVILAQLRAYIGRNSPLDDTGFYANIYVIDTAILKAIEELEEGEYLSLLAAGQADYPAFPTAEWPDFL